MPHRALFAGVLILVFAAAAACEEDKPYPADRADEEYDLAAMALADEDLPGGWEQVINDEFDNAVTAQQFVDELDPDVEAATEALERQLEAKGRVKAQVTVYQREDPASMLAAYSLVYSQSTLFRDAEAARSSLREVCDLQQYREAQQLRDLLVPALGEGSVSFEVTLVDESSGIVSRDTVICFRTGRIVHSIVTSGFAGSEDFGATYTYATRMAERVDAAY